jgi:N-methylhydantoinase B
LRDDSGGAGRHRGGLGSEKAVIARARMNISVRVDRVHCPPWGLQGGMAGMGNKLTLTLDGREIDDLPNAKVYGRPIKAGDGWSLFAGGGGGFGPPHERAAAKVAHDVRQGYVSREAARELYGVEINERGEVDLDATRRLRTEPATRLRSG